MTACADGCELIFVGGRQERDDGVWRQCQRVSVHGMQQQQQDAWRDVIQIQRGG